MIHLIVVICFSQFFPRSVIPEEFSVIMPNQKKNKIKPDPKPVLKGVIGVVVPKKAPEPSIPVYKYLKDNADYSEKKCTSTEDTKSFRLQIEEHLNNNVQFDAM